MELKLFPEKNFTNISEDYKKFAECKISCQSCSIFDSYKKVVSSEGNANNPTFMFIGEAPGSDEVINDRPFYGKAGQRIRKELRKYPEVFNKKTSIFTNVIPCRPKDNKFPSKDQEFSITSLSLHEKPRLVNNTQAVNHCRGKWLDKEIEILKPKILIALGSQSLFYVFGKSGITQNRGKWDFLSKYNAWVFGTYHPSYVLRCQNDSNKSNVVNEFESDIRQIATEWRSILENSESKKEIEDDYIDSYVNDLFGV